MKNYPQIILEYKDNDMWINNIIQLTSAECLKRICEKILSFLDFFSLKNRLCMLVLINDWVSLFIRRFLSLLPQDFWLNF